MYRMWLKNSWMESKDYRLRSVGFKRFTAILNILPVAGTGLKHLLTHGNTTLKQINSEVRVKSLIISERNFIFYEIGNLSSF